MTVDTLTELTSRVAALEARVFETPDQRAAREEANFQTERIAHARAAEVDRKRARLATLDRDLAQQEPWLEWMSRTRDVIEGELAQATKALEAGNLDRWQEEVARRRVEALSDALICLETGNWLGPSGDLFARARRENQTLHGNLGFTRTLRAVEALRQDRATAQGELNQVLGST